MEDTASASEAGEGQMGVAQHKGNSPNSYDRVSLAASEQPVSRRRFLSVSLTASAGLMLLGGTGCCRRATRRGLREGKRERTGGEGGVEGRDCRRRHPVRGGRLRRLLRRLF